MFLVYLPSRLRDNNFPDFSDSLPSRYERRGTFETAPIASRAKVYMNIRRLHPRSVRCLMRDIKSQNKKLLMRRP